MLRGYLASLKAKKKKENNGRIETSVSGTGTHARRRSNICTPSFGIISARYSTPVWRLAVHSFRCAGAGTATATSFITPAATRFPLMPPPLPRQVSLTLGHKNYAHLSACVLVAAVFTTGISTVFLFDFREQPEGQLVPSAGFYCPTYGCPSCLWAGPLWKACTRRCMWISCSSSRSNRARSGSSGTKRYHWLGPLFSMLLFRNGVQASTMTTGADG